jgi:hypothetical protein
MVTHTYGVCLVTFLLSKSGIFCYFCRKIPRFLSLFSVPIVTFHKATFNKIKDFREGGLQVETGERERQRMENASNVYVFPPWPHGIDVLCNLI